jgi:ATP-dependent DNA helicase DinG
VVLPGASEQLAVDGVLAKRIRLFETRPSQQEMAAEIEAVIDRGGALIAESGTGTGKTFAYLVPVIQSGRRAILSTATKTLQDQLFDRDLPLVREALDLPLQVARLKGRSNYLCLYRYKTNGMEVFKMGAAMRSDFDQIRQWSAFTPSGDIGEVDDIAEDSRVWPMVTSTLDNCLGGKCPDVEKCWVIQARKEALNADLVIINHHLFFADLNLKEEGFGQLLPGAEVVVFDEAHRLPGIAQDFVGEGVTGYQFYELAKDLRVEERREKSGVEGLIGAADKLEKAAADLRLSLGRESRRGALADIEGDQEFQKTVNRLSEALIHFTGLLEAAAPVGDGLERCYQRAHSLRERFHLILDRDSIESVRWFETTPRSFSLRMTPLDIGTTYRKLIASDDRAWLFTSATLSINGDFSLYQERMGLEEAMTALWQSPFDYQSQALLYLPEGLPEPRISGYTELAIEAIIPVLKATAGRAFILFTSYRALDIAHEVLEGEIDHPLLVQGSAPRGELLEQFRKAGDAVLLGTSSFWEGIDVRGEALSCVVIDKLPFAVPDEPVLRGRMAALEAEGRNPFFELQVPEAAITLKQGAGRLIRDATDRGVLMICDPRLVTKGYGKTFLDSLPPMKRTRSLEEVEAFFVS